MIAKMGDFPITNSHDVKGITISTPFDKNQCQNLPMTLDLDNFPKSEIKPLIDIPLSNNKFVIYVKFCTYIH